MQDYQVIAMVVLFGPKKKHIQNQVQEDVKKITSEQLHVPSSSLGHQLMNKSKHYMMKPSFIASASVFGPKVIFSVGATEAANNKFLCYTCTSHVFLNLE
ncbi:hypothetical protein CIPAW_09G216300 [Carya illinoinensis]|uniref:Uncharacterized protein n=1 Tax=Carya illinoinensis TaxID=32201 RepID=A0A8T1PMZ4_CARIL|nr:hypothetical protein CIPAW_09G216300 [Carya illinoinensis]